MDLAVRLNQDVGFNEDARAHALPHKSCLAWHMRELPVDVALSSSPGT